MRLIDADALTKVLNDTVLNDTTCPIHIAATVEQDINYAPTVDAEPVRHGRMADSKIQGYYECTCCGAKVDKTVTLKFDYCYHCGARMDRGHSDGT